MFTEPAPELSIVIPAYNEEARIENTIRRWQACCVLLGLDVELIVVDDGSTDGTRLVLTRLIDRDVPNLRIVAQSNGGHGAALRRGYAAARGRWILQIDADDEVGPDAFADLWKHRVDADLVLGVRCARPQTSIRRWVSRGARWLGLLVCGRVFQDPNVPYRLLSRHVLSCALERAPETATTPNLLMTWLAQRCGLRVHEVRVPVVRMTSDRQLAGWPLVRTVCHALVDAWRVRFLDLLPAQHESGIDSQRQSCRQPGRQSAHRDQDQR